MREPKPAPVFAVWAPAESPLTIEYSLDVMEQIRATAAASLRQLSRGGLETGGVLLGARGEGSIKITDYRPIECEHARGPAFLLTQNDRLALGRLLQTAKRDSEGNGTHALGWFVSHTRSGVALTESDRKIYDHYFPWSWQTTLIVHPLRDTSAEAGFFVREADGKLQAEASYQPFRIEPMVRSQPVGQPERVPKRALVERIQDQPDAPPMQLERVRPAPAPATLEEARAPSPKAAAQRALRDRRIWIWAVPALLAIVVLAAIVDRNGTPAPQPSFAFRASDSGGELHMEWNKQAEVVRDAVRGTLDIEDGPSTLQLPLDSERLHDGTFTYTRKTGDLEVRMTVYPVNGSPVQETARFVGEPVTPPTNPGDTAQLRREKDGLTAEIGRLQESLRKETARNKELEQMVRILENRLQVEKLRAPGAATTEK